MAGVVEPSAHQADQADAASMSLPWSVKFFSFETSQASDQSAIHALALQVGKVHPMEAHQRSRERKSGA